MTTEDYADIIPRFLIERERERENATVKKYIKFTYKNVTQSDFIANLDKVIQVGYLTRDFYYILIGTIRVGLIIFSC